MQRGVAVWILTNSLKSNNHLPACSAYRRHLRALVELGADDDGSYVGSSSLDRRSLRRNTEMRLVIEGQV